MYAGPFIFFEKGFNPVTEPLRDESGQPTNRLVLDTIVFHTFILMNMFNQINCRVVDAQEINVFATLFNNPMFFVIFGFEMLVQHMMINAGYSNLGSALIGTAPMSVGQTWTCWGLGILPLAVNVALKQIPLESFAFVRYIDLESENKDEFINKYMDKQNNLVNQSMDLTNEKEKAE